MLEVARQSAAGLGLAFAGPTIVEAKGSGDSGSRVPGVLREWHGKIACSPGVISSKKIGLHPAVHLDVERVIIARSAAGR